MRTASPAGLGQRIWIRSLLSCAGVLGAFGVGVGAAGTHAGGGDLARVASLFLLIHAAAVIGLVAVAERSGHARPAAIAGTILVLGVACFSGDLAVLAFTGQHLLSPLAPIGGSLLILGWIAVALVPWLGSRNGAV